MLNAAVISAIEDFAPASYQQSWDNTGVQIGSLRAECTGVLLCIDVTPDIVDEAHRRACNLIISHHPLLFRGLKRLSGNTPVEEAVIRAISYGITVYSCHTAIDSTQGGVSYRMAQMLGATPIHVLSPLKDCRAQISAIVNDKFIDTALAVIHEISGQHNCFISKLSSARLATDKSDPFGSTETLNTPCAGIEAIINPADATRLQTAMAETLGKEMLSFSFRQLADYDPHIGLGVFATLSQGIPARQLIEQVKTVFKSPVARCTAIPDDTIIISRIAMCGGSGSEFITDAIRAGAQAFITSDTRYHDFVDYQNEILIIDIGHFESESCTKEIFHNVIREKFPNFACYYSEIEENPIKYI